MKLLALIRNSTLCAKQSMNWLFGSLEEVRQFPQTPRIFNTLLVDEEARAEVEGSLCDGDTIAVFKNGIGDELRDEYEWLNGLARCRFSTYLSGICVKDAMERGEHLEVAFGKDDERLVGRVVGVDQVNCQVVTRDVILVRPCWRGMHMIRTMDGRQTLNHWLLRLTVDVSKDEPVHVYVECTGEQLLPPSDPVQFFVKRPPAKYKNLQPAVPLSVDGDDLMGFMDINDQIVRNLEISNVKTAMDYLLRQLCQARFLSKNKCSELSTSEVDTSSPAAPSAS